jgi:multidrug transporter EmrE-like cation transporter
MLLFFISGLFVVGYIALKHTRGIKQLLSGLGNLLCYFAVFVFIVSTFTKTMHNRFVKKR